MVRPARADCGSNSVSRACSAIATSLRPDAFKGEANRGHRRGGNGFVQ